MRKSLKRAGLIAVLVSVALPGPSIAQHRPAVYALSFSPDGKALAVGTHGRALLYETSGWQLTAALDKVQYAVRSVAFHPDGKHIAVGSGVPGESGDLVMWDIRSPEKLRSYARAKDTVEAIAFSANGESMASASFDSKARFYPQTFDDDSSLLEEHNGRVTSVAFSPKPNSVFATGAMDKMVKIWDFKKVNVVVNFDQATEGITGIAFLANGDQLVGSSLDGNLYWWGIGYDEKQKVYSGSPIRTVPAHERGVTAFSASGNRERIATAGMDKRVCVWKIDDGSLVHEFKDVAGAIYCTALSSDGKIIAAAGGAGVVWVWEVESGKLLTTLIPRRMPAVARTQK
jgi:WD40 repeat protein